MKSIFKKVIVKILIWEAHLALKAFRPKIVAVTGSVGKTGSKDAIYTLLSASEYVRKSEKSFNSEIGVPLTILGLPNAWNSFIGWIENIAEGFILPYRNKKYPSWLVLEIGVDHPGDVERFSWLKPSIVVFTKFPQVPVHVEHFTDPQEVIDEKRKLKQYLAEEGTLIINADDPLMYNEEVKDGQHLISYGLADHATVRGFDYTVVYDGVFPEGISFKVQFQEKVIDIHLAGVLGEHHMYPVLSAIAVHVAEGKIFERANNSFENHTFAPGRMRLLHGMHSSLIIDDTYNSSPIAVETGIRALSSIEQTHGKKIAVLGDMLELGEFSVEQHQKVGEFVANAVDVLVAVGVRSRATAEVVQSRHGRCKHVEFFKTAHEAVERVRQIVGENDIVFVKGSQGMRMERIVEQILKEPRSAVQLLPRQDTHWKAKE